MSASQSQDTPWTLQLPYRGPPRQIPPALPTPTTSSLSSMPEISNLVDRLHALTSLPQDQQDHFVILDVWDELRAAYWRTVHAPAPNGSTVECTWPTFVTRFFGDRVDRVLGVVYRPQYQAMVQRDWKALVRFYRVQRALKLTAPGVFLHLGRQIATSSRSLKTLCRLLDHPRKISFQGSEVLSVLQQAMVARHDGAGPPELELRDLNTAVQELNRRRRASRATEHGIATAMGNLTIGDTFSPIQQEDKPPRA
ncbi:hypothetical protein CGLO_13179 [Colletotrichum gloeosporioides Cg-14]|uniref:Uncharacterized protein n=1 Tax=Colletotrichum gloeosporioides (strain Cg-14) TaxID=1237896 RepID=T0JX03_COLGC|nr:hypothetical protein CGLO_13179 [Colletotrichum gloeosporioides Cg-14]